MTIPAQAFADGYPKDIPLSSLFKFRGNWAMLVGDADDLERDFILLTGERAGQLLPVRPGMAKAVFVNAPFGWFPAIEDTAIPTSEGKQPPSLTLTENELVIVGGRVDDDEPEYVAYGLDGVVRKDHPRNLGVLRFTQWSAHLQHKERPFRSLCELFTVG